MRIEKLSMTIEEQAAMELANAQAERNYADTVYIAMMAGIDIPSLEEDEEVPYEV